MSFGIFILITLNHAHQQASEIRNELAHLPEHRYHYEIESEEFHYKEYAPKTRKMLEENKKYNESKFSSI